MGKQEYGVYVKDVDYLERFLSWSDTNVYITDCDFRDYLSSKFKSSDKSAYDFTNEPVFEFDLDDELPLDVLTNVSPFTSLAKAANEAKQNFQEKLNKLKNPN